MRVLDLADMDTRGPALIEASAGTGKTWTITALYILLLLEERMRPEEILVLTYTNAATAELRDRIRKRIAATLELYAVGREPADELERLLQTTRMTDAETAKRLLTRALYCFDSAAIFTIHGFCRRALLENAFESGSLFDTELSADQSALVRQTCDDFWRARIMTAEGTFLERLVAEGYTPDRLAAPFAGHYQNPDLRVIPETTDPDLDALIAERDALFPALAAMWRGEREVVCRELNGAGLSRTSYKPERIEAAARRLDACLADGSIRSGGDALKLFTTAGIVNGMKKGSTEPTHPFFGLCQQLHDAVVRVDNGFRDKLIHRRTELQRWLRMELPRRKQALNLRGYDDLLLDLHLALEGTGGDRLATSLRQSYRAALIDEFQDTDPLQWRILARIAGADTKPISGVGQGDEEEATQAYMTIRRGASDEVNAEIRPKAASYPLFLIGDPKQAIYSFRGADIQAYIAAARTTDPGRRRTLETNRRSTPQIVEALNTLFDTPDPFLSPDIRFSRVKPGRDRRQQLLRNGSAMEQPLRFWVYRREDQSRAVNKGTARAATVAATAAEIARLLDGTYEIVDREGRQRPLWPGDIAVLVKAHYQADLVQEALSSLGIPSVQHGSATIFESREALDLLRILRAAADPARGALLREALLSAVIGLSANELFALPGDEGAWELWIMRFRALHDAARTGGIIALASRLLGECGVRERALSNPDGERRLTNVLHCCELLHRAEEEHGQGLEGSIAWLERRIAGREEDEAWLLRLETDANAVTLATIHASKGLEYPVVFLPFAWDPPSAGNDRVLFHDDDGALTLDLGSEKLETEHGERARAEQEAEAARLFYVAATRAEFLCYVAWGCINGAWGSPLRRLLHGTSFKDAKAFAAAGDGEILEQIAALAERGAREGGPAPISAEYMPTDAPAPPFCPEADAPLRYDCRESRGTVPGDWKVSSFSALAGGGERQQPRDHDADPASTGERSAGGDAPSSEPRTGLSIFDFPRGAAAGSCLHELFERLDFSDITDASLDRLAAAALQRNGYDPRWLPAVQRMVRNVAAAPLIPADPAFSLSRLKPGSWLTEMEFFLPLGVLSGARLGEVFSGLLEPGLHGGFAEVLDALRIQETRGMLHGFMDMVFEHEGRYYLIDWKSNHLGDRPGDYRQEALCEPMARHAYILQYHLYALALDRWLRLRLPGYDYGTHFGGALYVFLRGVSAGDPECGIFRDRPSAEFIRRANEIILSRQGRNRPRKSQGQWNADKI